MNRKRLAIIIGTLLILLASGFIIYRVRSQQNVSATQSKYQTVVAERGTLTATVGANGNMRAKQSTNIYWQTTGRVGNVNVKVGQVVKSGEELASIDKNYWSQNILQAQNDLINAQQALQDLYDNADKNKAQAISDMLTAQDKYDQTKRNRDGMNGPTRGTQETIDKYQADYALAKEQQKQAQENFNAVAGLEVDNPTRAQALRTLSNSNSSLVTAAIYLNYYQGKPDAQDFKQADAELTLAKSTLDAAVRKADVLQNGPSSQDISLAKGKIEIAQTTLNQVRLTAPFDGTITEVNIRPGDTASSNAAAIRIDDLTALYVDLQVSEVDINRVKTGQKVTMTFDAISDKVYEGTINEVGMVGVNSSGAINFSVTVQMTNPDDMVKTGMTAAGNIIVAQIDNALIVPNVAVQLVKNKPVIYTLSADNSTLKAVDIQIGASSDEMSEIISGDLKEGENIVLNPPAQNQMGPGGPGGGPGGPD
jgi:HlyD family secretion protein